jgi:hypothetical protein
MPIPYLIEIYEYLGEMQEKRKEAMDRANGKVVQRF